MRREAMGAEVPMFAKGSAGAREAFSHLRRGGVLGMLVDQKLNEGLAVPFFGRPAMTTPALAQFALRFRCPVIPVRPVRLGPARFRVICEPPMALPDTNNRTTDVYCAESGDECYAGAVDSRAARMLVVVTPTLA
jgi:Kdo2-lipid IVA lauroyltransferase/acyltransferase